MPEQQCLNAKKSLALASHLFPHETWIPTETNIWVARSRLAEEYREPDKWGGITRHYRQKINNPVL
jgi:hypothetical protein